MVARRGETHEERRFNALTAKHRLSEKSVRLAAHASVLRFS